MVKKMSPIVLAENLDLYESIRGDCKKIPKRDGYSESKDNFSFNYKYVGNRMTNFAVSWKYDSEANIHKSKTQIVDKFTCYSCGEEGEKSPFCLNKRGAQTAQRAHANSVQSAEKAGEDRSSY